MAKQRTAAELQKQLDALQPGPIQDSRGHQIRLGRHPQELPDPGHPAPLAFASL